MQELLDAMTLLRVPGVGNTTFWRLVHHFGSPAAVLAAPVGQILSSLEKKTGSFSSSAEIAAFRDASRKEVDSLQKIGAEAVWYGDPSYPPLLKETADPPGVLYMMGRKEVLQAPCVAVVGSRAATRYGEHAASDFSRQLAASGVTVVSGLALGIDGAAHRGALLGHGATAAVLGCGLDVPYPRQNESLFREIVQAGGLVISENPLGTLPEAFRFPARNRIIAGVSLGVLVVEAARKSGSRITAQFALDEGRDVYAIPGRIDSCKSEGTHILLQQGAKLVFTVNDILEELPPEILSPAASAAPISADPENIDSTETEEGDERHLLQYLDAYPIARDELVRLSGMDVSALSEALLLLELDGLIEIVQGGMVRKV